MKAVIITTYYIGKSQSNIFDIYTDFDNYTTPIETGITRNMLNAGYVTYNVPDTATRIKLYSNSTCGKLPLSGQPIIPGVIYSGLTTYLDAGNLTSYPTTGSTWYNLANNRNYTLNNTSFSNGSLEFINGDAVDLNGIQNPNINAKTTEVWFKWRNVGYVPTHTTQMILGSGISTVSVYGFTTGIISGNTGYNYFYGSLGNGLPFGPQTGSTIIQENTWYYAATTFTGTQLKIYINGVLDLISNVSGVYDDGPFRIAGGGNYSFTETFGGDVAIVRYYNRVLSNSEILNNFNADKNRFNII